VGEAGAFACMSSTSGCGLSRGFRLFAQCVIHQVGIACVPPAHVDNELPVADANDQLLADLTSSA
jgi:hypothetical protein